MKKGMVNALILVLVLVNLVLTIILTFTFVPAIKKTSSLVDKISEVVDLEVGGNTSGIGNVAVADLDAVAVTFSGENETTVALKLGEGENPKIHYLKYSITVNLNKKHSDYKEVSQTIASSMSIVAGSINDVISGYTYEGFDKAVVANAVLKNLQELLESECVYSVSFSTFTLN